MTDNRTPIEPKDIRKGDSIRVEWTRSQCGSPRALEYIAPHDRTGMRKKMDAAEWETATHYLLDRPTPPVELPTEPTLGWLDWRVGGTNNFGRTFDFWSSPGPNGCAMRGLQVPEECETALGPDRITAFTPATAVPTEALAMLQAGCFMNAREAAEVIAHFLAAVDSANGATR